METQTEAPKKDERDIVARLRDTPNWLREPWSVSWKDLTHKYDRAPFEAAEEIERLRALLRRGMRQLEAWQEFYGRHCNGPTMGNVLPPAGDVQWAEAVGEALTTPNAGVKAAAEGSPATKGSEP